MEVPLAMVKLGLLAAAVTPAHVPVLPAVPIVIPAGNVSVKRLVSVIAPALVLPRVTVRVVLPPLAMLAAPNAFATVGAADTVMLALPVAPVMATGPVMLTVPVVLFLTPAVVPVTLTCTWQLEFSASEPPVSVSVVSPAVAPGLTVPPHVLVRPGTVATCRPAG